MIYDPENVKIAMDDSGRLYVPRDIGPDAQGNPEPVWVPMQTSNCDGDFRRPEW